jgi:hypothetical protein
MTAGVTRGDIGTAGSHYQNNQGGAGKMTRSVDPNQYAAAVYMIKVATDNMHSQFAGFLTVFDDLA